MRILLLTAFCIGCVYTSPVDVQTRFRGGPPQFSCEGRKDGFYADRHRFCRVYYECKGGQENQFHPCDDGLIFDEKIWACGSEETTHCPAPEPQMVKRFRGGPPQFSCEGRDDGFYADRHRFCRVFYECKGGQQKQFHCDDGLIFDEKKRACGSEESTECPFPDPQMVKRFRGGAPVFDCEGKVNGVYADLHRMCHAFWICESGKGNMDNCVDGTLFDSEVNACVPEHTTVCPSDTKKRELFERIRQVSSTDDKLARQLEHLLKRIQKNRK